MMKCAQALPYREFYQAFHSPRWPWRILARWLPHSHYQQPRAEWGRSQCPPHKLPFAHFFGQKVNAIEWVSKSSYTLYSRFVDCCQRKWFCIAILSHGIDRPRVGTRPTPTASLRSRNLQGVP